MIKKVAVFLSISAAYFINAQDISTLRNSAEVYSNSSLTGSARYNAMAGSMGALGGDISTLNSNPAGIGVNITSEISGSLGIIQNKNTSSLAGQSLGYKINSTDISNLSGIVAFPVSGNSAWKFVNVGVNYSEESLEDYTETPGNSNVKFNFYDNANVLIDELSLEGHAYNRYGHRSKMSVAVGGNYDHKIYIGAGLNFHTAVLDQYDSAAFSSVKWQSTDVYDKQYTPFSENSTGFSASVGVIGKINPQFRLGASIETPTWWNIDRIYREYENPIDGSYSEKRTLSTPLKATFSAAFVPTKNLALNLDYSIGVTKPKYGVEGPAEKELNNFFSDHSKNVSEVKAGAEYRVGGLRLRTGYGYASSPFNEVTVSSYNDAGIEGDKTYNNLLVGNRTTFGAGIGYDFKIFYIDAAYQNVTSDYQNPFLKGSASYNTGYFSDRYAVESNSSAVSNVSNKRDNFYLTVGWKF